MAVDQSVFQTQGSAAKAPSTYYVKQNGVISEVEITADQFKAVSPGYHRLRLRGMSAPFEMTGEYGVSRNVRVVFQVRDQGTEEKRMFSQLLTIAKPDKSGGWRPNITEKTAVGQMIGVMRGKPIAENEPINVLDYLNGKFAAMVDQTAKPGQNGMEVYGNVVKDTWKPVGQTALPNTEPLPPALQPTAAPNPFMDSDD
jgi:hypothetical protein